jgi:GntR family transcriptional regulator
LIQISYSDAKPIYEKVKDSLCRMILTGALPPDSRLPSVRELAMELAINPNTIQRAYRELEQEGYIVSVPGKGSFVSRDGTARRQRRQELAGKLQELVRELKTLGATEDELISLVKEEE